jgi:DNA mismatch repair protein MutS2
MDKAMFASLQFNEVLELITPVGESGKNHKYHIQGFKPGQEAHLCKEYNRLDCLLSALKKDRKLSEQLNSSLSATPYLPQTLKALQKRSLLLHECFEIKKLLHYVLQLKQLCTKAGLLKHYPFPELQKLYNLLDPEKTQSPTFALTASFAPILAKLLLKTQELHLAKRQAEHKLLVAAQKAAGLKNPIAEIVVSRLDSKKLQKVQKSGYYILSGENFANLTFRLKDSRELTAIKKQISSLAPKLGKSEEKVLTDLSKKIKSYQKSLLKAAELVQILDWDYAKAVFALKHHCTIPKITDEIKINAIQVVNLPVKLNLTEHNRKYQPLDLLFDDTLNVLTGPNMGGKTTTLHTVGQLCLLACYGIPVPAEKAELCLFDNLWHNAETEGGENLSSFGREIVTLANMLNKKGRTLYLFDELAKGTNPMEGEAILTAVMQYLSAKSCLVLTATHYDIPVRLKKVIRFAIKGIDTKALKRLAKADKLSLDTQLDLLNQLMDYSLIKVSDKQAPPKNAITIAEILGLPGAIIRLAQKKTNQT